MFSCQVQDIKIVFFIIAQTALSRIVALNQDFLLLRMRPGPGGSLAIDLLLEREFCAVEHFLVDFEDALPQHLVFLFLEIFQIVVPGLGDQQELLSIGGFSLPLDLVDLLHLEPGDQDRGYRDGVVLVVAPHPVDEALFHKVVDVFSVLD